MAGSTTNAWLRGQRKSDLVELADVVGLKQIQSLKKTELEVALDAFIVANSPRLSSLAALRGYYASRAKALAAAGAQVKREREEERAALVQAALKTRLAREAGMMTPGRAAKREEEEEEEEEDEYDEEEEDAEYGAGEVETDASSSSSSSSDHASDDNPSASSPDDSPTALVPHTPLPLPSSTRLPASPADIVLALDASASLVRARVAALAAASPLSLTSCPAATRRALSSVSSVLTLVAALELWYLRPAILPDVYAFTIPPIPALGLSAPLPVHLPNMFLLVSPAFWSPALTWLLTGLVLPCVAGYLCNLCASASGPSLSPSTSPSARRFAASSPTASPKLRALRPRLLASHRRPLDVSLVDPLTFSVVKALVSYLVYAQGATMGGLLNPDVVASLDAALYGGWRGILVGTAITGLMSIYDAALRN